MCNNPKILLLDDNKDLLLIVQIILKGQGHDTVIATTIEEAEQKIRIHKPALILMDVFIGDQDGREFCNKLKYDSQTSHTKIIMMSGLDNALGLMNNILADDFMPKPFNYDDLVDRVQMHLLEAQHGSVEAES